MNITEIILIRTKLARVKQINYTKTKTIYKKTKTVNENISADGGEEK